ncbi:hypothetical protein CcaCcLH18_04969 [Colletotrichum camelliae]|nr:hypothetical protein CcaCcLH18_04969 [Colletotrichum camelliae]
MDYYRLNYYGIVWMDSFLFFYWDIRRYRPADEENIDRLIIDYFQRKEPNITSSQDPSPWNTLLCHLMRSLACLLGIITDSEQTHRYEWLRRDVGEPGYSRPFVDWLDLEAIIYRQLVPHPGEQVSALISHINTTYEQHSMERLGWVQSWKGNPFLNEFGRAHRADHWTLPLPTPADRLLTLIWKYQPKSCKCQGQHDWSNSNCQLPLLRIRLLDGAVAETYDIVLQKYNRTSMAQLRPFQHLDECCIPLHANNPQSAEYYATRRTINLGKRIFTSMLFWVDEMCRTGRLLSLCDILDRRFEQWPLSDAEDTLRVNYELWEAVRYFGLRPISTKGEVWSDGAKTPTKSETLSVTG